MPQQPLDLETSGWGIKNWEERGGGGAGEQELAQLHEGGPAEGQEQPLPPVLTVRQIQGGNVGWGRLRCMLLMDVSRQGKWPDL